MAADNAVPGERIILLAHGSRDAGWERPFKAVLREFRERFPRREVDLAFLQFMSPDLPSALGAAWRQGARQVRVVPLFLGSGRHLQCDLADIVRSTMDSDATFYKWRTKATLIYRKTKNLRAVQLLLGHTWLESTVRYLGIEVEDALDIAEQIEI